MNGVFRPHFMAYNPIVVKTGTRNHECSVPIHQVYVEILYLIDGNVYLLVAREEKSEDPRFK